MKATPWDFECLIAELLPSAPSVTPLPAYTHRYFPPPVTGMTCPGVIFPDPANHASVPMPGFDLPRYPPPTKNIRDGHGTLPD